MVEVVSSERIAEVEPSVAGVSWAAVVSGAVASLAITLILMSFGAGMGFSMASPWTGAAPSATTFKISTGIYLLVIAMISSAIGGHLAGRLRSRWIGVHSDEVYFRDTVHGFLAWALASVLGAILLTSAATTLIGGAATGLTQSTTNAPAQSSGPMDGYVDRLLRSDASVQQNANDAVTRAELARLFTSSFRNGGDLSASDHAYVAKVVSSKTGLSQADADKRVTEVSNQAKTDLDNARKAAAQLAFWLTASLLLGAFSASLAATEGGGWRDGTLRKTQR
jgi:hypothetical protein